MRRPLQLHARSCRLLLAAVCLLPAGWSLVGRAAAEPSVSFRREIAPILLRRCESCHGEKKARGKFRLDSYARAVERAADGTAGVVARNLAASKIYERIIAVDADERMPAEADALPGSEIALVRRWIEEGAPFDGTNTAATLASIIPSIRHPDPPEAYARLVPIVALAFSREGRELFTGGYHEINVWDAATGAPLRRIRNQGQRTLGLSVHPGQDWLACAGGSPGRLGEVRVFHSGTGDLLQVLDTTSDLAIAAAFSPNGARLATGSADGRIRIYETNGWRLVRLIENHADWVNAISWSPDSLRLASASRDKTAKVFDALSGQRLATFSGHDKPILAVAFHPEGREVFSCGVDRTICRWLAADGKKTAELARLDAEVLSLSVGRDILLATCADGSSAAFSLADNKPVLTRKGHADWVTSGAQDGVSRRVATGSFDGRVLVWESRGTNPVFQFTAAPGWAKRQEPR